MPGLSIPPRLIPGRLREGNGEEPTAGTKDSNQQASATASLCIGYLTILGQTGQSIALLLSGPGQQEERWCQVHHSPLPNPISPSPKLKSCGLKDDPSLCPTGHWELPPSYWLNRHPQASFLPTYALEHPEEEGENTFDSLSPQL